ncbi:Hypothetical predicted protein [Mytilus galloprovincialis]|uniref:WSC domain-containing protein n=2 Tax=Mytilus galloprovincialis TaxID=29158 RepID=A0A8B6BG69_MYTGA|nr:Hypothetical predicted protein [Mytilus galloprovincialis]
MTDKAGFVYYKYSGCYQNDDQRLFDDGPHYSGDEMSSQICFQYCSFSGNIEINRFFATSNKSSCYCGSEEELGSGKYQKRDDSECSLDCLGHLNEKCGALLRASVYEICIGNASDIQEAEESRNRTFPVSSEVSTTKPSHGLTRTGGDIGTAIGVSTVLVYLLVASLIYFFVLRRPKPSPRRLTESRPHNQHIRHNISVPSMTDISEKTLIIQNETPIYENTDSVNLPSEISETSV